MMGTQIAELYAKIGADTTGLKRGLQETKTGLQQANSQVGSMASSLKGLAAGFAALGIARVAKELYEFGKAGAELDYTRQKFDRLATSMGAASDVMMKDLRAATKGTMSDMQLAAGAGDLMGLGLAKTSAEAVRLTKVVGGLGMNMNQLVLTLTNQTTMRFDQLGVSVAGFDEKVKRLKATGMSASDAFQEAFLQQAEEQLNRVGNAADTDIGKIRRLESSLTNFADTAKVKIAPGIAAVAEELTHILDGTANADTAAATINDFFQGTFLESSISKFNRVREKIERNKDIDMGFTYDSSNTAAAKAAREYNTAMSRRYSMAGAMVQQLGDLSFAEARNAFMVEYTEQNMEKLNLFMSGPVSRENEAYIKNQRQLQKSLSDTISKIKELEKTPWKKEELAEARAEYGTIKETIKETGEEHSRQSKQMIYDLTAQRLARGGITTEESKFLAGLAQEFGLIDDATKAMWDNLQFPLDSFEQGKSTAEETLEILGRMAKTWIVTIQYGTGGNPPVGAGPGQGFSVYGPGQYKPQPKLLDRGKAIRTGYIPQGAQGGGGFSAYGGSYTAPETGWMGGVKSFTGSGKMAKNPITEGLEGTKGAAVDLKSAIDNAVSSIDKGKTNADLWTGVMKGLTGKMWTVKVLWLNEGNPPTGSVGSKDGKSQPAEAFASGGTYRAGVPRLVGERGPELDIPSSSGRVVSNDDLRAMLGGGGRGGVTQKITVNLALPRDNYTARQFMRELQTLGGV